jgi:hypothetical protein
MTAEELHRLRLERLARVLRQFGVVDRFDLAGLLSARALPTREAVLKKLRQHKDHLPSGVPAEFLADSVITELAQDDFAAEQAVHIARALSQLKEINTGHAHAGKYHDKASEILNLLFSDEIEFVRKEAPMHGGRKKVDLLFRIRDSGALAALLSARGIQSILLPVEVKNYEDDPANNEFDQLSGRLKPDVGKFGISVCRDIKDSAAVRRRCADYKQKGEYIVVLTDDDLIEASRQLARGERVTVLEERIMQLFLD